MADSGLEAPCNLTRGGEMLQQSERRQTALTFLFFCLAAWAAHFCLSGRFLLYEDDYAVMGRSLDMDLPALWGIVRALWVDCPMARPLHFTFGRVFSYLGVWAAGLQGMYWIAYAIVCLNAILFFTLLKKLAPAAPAFFGALCFLLFPADATKPLLTHALMIQPGLTCLLTALLIHAGKHVWLSYIVILGSLLTYEPTALPFLMAPLLKKPWDRPRMKIFLRHILLIFSCLALAGLLRFMLHEARMSELASGGLVEAAAKALGSLVLGPLTVLWTFASRVFSGMADIRPWSALAACAFLILGIPLALALQRNDARAGDGEPRKIRFSLNTRLLDFSFEMTAAGHHRGVFRLAVLGASMGICAYLLSFSYWPPMVAAGRETCVHIAASVGWSMVFAAAAWTLMAAGRVYNRPWGAACVLTAYLALLLCFHASVQEDFAESAQVQRAFWRQVVSLCPDVEEGTVIFVRGKGLPQTKYIRSNFWTDRLILELMYDFPADWKEPPRLYILDYQISHSLRRGRDGEVMWDRPVPPPENLRPSVIKPGSLILLEMDGGRLARRCGSMVLGPDLPLQLKPRGAGSLRDLPARPLFAWIAGR